MSGRERVGMVDDPYGDSHWGWPMQDDAVTYRDLEDPISDTDGMTLSDAISFLQECCSSGRIDKEQQFGNYMKCLRQDAWIGQDNNSLEGSLDDKEL
jgi:hypothetical protein